jgi:hypothetical protein
LALGYTDIYLEFGEIEGAFNMERAEVSTVFGNQMTVSVTDALGLRLMKVVKEATSLTYECSWLFYKTAFRRAGDMGARNDLPVNWLTRVPLDEEFDRVVEAHYEKYAALRHRHHLRAILVLREKKRGWRTVNFVF